MLRDHKLKRSVHDTIVTVKINAYSASKEHPPL